MTSTRQSQLVVLEIISVAGRVHPLIEGDSVVMQHLCRLVLTESRIHQINVRRAERPWRPGTRQVRPKHQGARVHGMYPADHVRNIEVAAAEPGRLDPRAA